MGRDAAFRVVVLLDGQQLAAELGDDDRLDEAGGQDLTTDDGWPLRVVVEADRVIAAGSFFGWGARLVVPGPTDRALEALRGATVEPTTSCALSQVVGPRALVHALDADAPLTFTGWSRRCHGADVEFRRDDGAAKIRVSEREGLPPPPVGPSRRVFATAGGDLGVQTVTRSPEGARSTAWILGEDRHTVVEATTTAPASVAVRRLFERFLHDYSFGAPEERLRRYLYAPPAGWMGLARGLQAEWHAPGYPARPGRIIVFPAYPLAHRRLVGCDQLLRGSMADAAAASRTVSPMRSPHGASGTRTISTRAASGGRQVVEEILLQDARFVYACRLETTHDHIDEQRRLLERVAFSSLPIPQAASGPKGQLFAAWAE